MAYSPTVKRRALLSAAAVGLIGSAGCASTVRRVLFGEGLPDHATKQFTVVAEASGVEGFPGPRDPPAVQFQQSGARVEVTGSVFVGTENCNKAGLQSIRYDSDARVLSADIGSVDEKHSEPCGAEESADAYRLVVEFDRNYPEAVEVTEGHGESKRTTTDRR